MSDAMEKRVCGGCQRLYSKGLRLVVDWAYWKRRKDSLTCPECQGVDVEAEMEKRA